MKSNLNLPKFTFAIGSFDLILGIGLVLLSAACGTEEPHQATKPSDAPRSIAAELGTRDTTAGGNSSTSFPDAAQHEDIALTYRIIDAPGGTYGYDILSDGNLFIHQTNIPGRPGTEGCRTREQAETLAKLVIEKVQAGEMPPTVTAEELTALNLN